MASDKPIRFETLEETAITFAEANARHWEEHHGTGVEHREYVRALDDVLCAMAIKSGRSYRPISSHLYKQKDAP
jgi:hypothetical protein